MSGTEQQVRGNRKTRRGKVVSKSGDKTVVVEIERKFRHPLYGKEVRSFKKLHAHDESNEIKVGDEVRIVECRPLSRMKHWRCVGIEGAAQAAE